MNARFVTLLDYHTVNFRAPLIMEDVLKVHDAHIHLLHALPISAVHLASPVNVSIMIIIAYILHMCMHIRMNFSLKLSC